MDEGGEQSTNSLIKETHTHTHILTESVPTGFVSYLLNFFLWN